MAKKRETPQTEEPTPQPEKAKVLSVTSKAVGVLYVAGTKIVPGQTVELPEEYSTIVDKFVKQGSIKLNK